MPLNKCSNWKSNHLNVFCKKDVLKIFAKFTGKHLFQSLFFDKVAGLRPATLSKKGLWHRCLPVNFAKLLRTPFLQNTSGGCFLNWISRLHYHWFLVLILVFLKKIMTREHLPLKDQCFPHIKTSQLICSADQLAGLHCVRNVHIRSYSCQHFPAFGLNTERYGI